MLIADGKEFVMKDVFTDVLTMEEQTDYYGEKVTHFGIPWEMNIYRAGNELCFYLKCLKSSDDWSIIAQANVKLANRRYEESNISLFFDSGTHSERGVDSIEFKNVKNHLVDNKLIVEMHVKITEMTGISRKKVKNFDDESAKNFSDVALVVKNEKFYVYKMYLASHSSYFKSLFMGNFDESKQSEITLNDIDSYDFQNFLELIHGVSDVNEDNVEGILMLADMYDSKTSVDRCEKFLTEHSKQSLEQKFHMAIKYKMDELKKKCMTEIKTKEDIRAVLPEDVHQMDITVWAELLHKCLSFK